MSIAFGGPAGARGLALMCGWGGGSLKHVSKYAQLWHKNGWRTAAAAMSIDMTFFPASWTEMKDVVETIANESRRHCASRPDALIACHAFSNAGVLMMLSVLEDAAGNAVRLDGAVYDSAPSRKGLVLPAGAPLVIASSGLPPSEAAFKLAVHTPHALAATLAFPFRQPPPPIGLFPKLFDAVTNAPRTELFIYGDQDRIIPPNHVEAFINLRAAQGSTILSPGCLRSGHVNHLRTNADTYAAALTDFTSMLERAT